MAFIGKTDIDKIERDLKSIITSKLLDGYKNRKTQPVVKVESVFLDYIIDESKSDRDNIFISPVKSLARVWVNLKDNVGQTNDQMQLRINSIQFSFNNESKEYEILDSDKVELIDMS